MRQPSMVLNSLDVPGPHYRMLDSYRLPPRSTAHTVVTLIQESAASSFKRGLPLLNVIINCHGSSGNLAVGGLGYRGITTADLPAFAALRGQPELGVTILWLVACKAVQGSKGKTFCSGLAKASGCRVIASEDSQSVENSAHYRLNNIQLMDSMRRDYPSLGLPAVGAIDEYEGVVWNFEPAGIMTIAFPHGLVDSVY